MNKLLKRKSSYDVSTNKRCKLIVKDKSNKIVNKIGNKIVNKIGKKNIKNIHIDKTKHINKKKQNNKKYNKNKKQIHHIKTKEQIPKRIRELVWTTYNGEVFTSKCYVSWCTNNINVFSFQTGHDIPESKGGTLDIYNLKPICGSCNLSMGNKYSITEWSKLINPIPILTTPPPYPHPTIINNTLDTLQKKDCNKDNKNIIKQIKNK
jgi:hypothetical protein